MEIERKVLESILELCRTTPHEIGGLLLGKKIINDYVLVPGRFGDYSIYIRFDQLPLYPDLAGTFHSHPGRNSSPSKEDLNFFGKLGRNHLIIAYPYNLNSFTAYDSKGNKIELHVKP